MPTGDGRLKIWDDNESTWRYIGSLGAGNALNGSPTTDQTATGPTTDTFNAGESVTIMDLVYMGSDGEWHLTDADSSIPAIDGLLAISLESKSDGQAMNVALPGSFVRNDAWDWTPGATLYVDVSPGGIVEVADLEASSSPFGTGDDIRVIGYAVSADVIYFLPGLYFSYA